MRKRIIIGSILIVVVIGVLLTPIVLRAIPPRYAARYLPAPLQAIAAPKTGSPILPTVSSPVDVAALLVEENDAQSAAMVNTPTHTPPPTFTAVPVENVDVTAVPPTETPIPPTPTNTAVPIPASARLEGFYHQFQDWNNCGPATMAMTMSYFGVALTQYDAATVLKPNPEDRNVSPFEMVNFVNEQTEYSAISRTNGTQETVKRLISEGVPVILEIGIEPPGEYRWMGWYGHYLLVVAYDDSAEQFWVYDSWLGTSGVPGENADANGRILTYDDVSTYWPQFNRNYIAVYAPEKETAVENIIGENLDDTIMWENNLRTAQRDAVKDPENAFYWFNLGTVYNALGQYEQAASAFDQARSIGLPWRMMWYQFGPYEAYYQIGRYEDVILLADVTLADRPYFEESFYYRGLANAALGNQAEAEKDWVASNNFNPNYQPAAMILSEVSPGN